MVSRAAAGQATPFVSPDERVYRDLDRLSAAGLIDTLIVGARPFTEREILRLLGEARRNLGRNPAARDWADVTIELDIARYTRGHNYAYDAVGAEEASLDSPYRGIPADGNGRIDAEINPLAAYRGGRPLAFGQTQAIETMHSALFGPSVAVALNPRITLQTPRGLSSSSTVRLQTGSANFLFGNVGVDVGRDYVLLGQSPTGGLLLSENAPALDMIRVENDRPFVLPWLLGLAGPIRATAFVADLGASAFHPHAKLAAWHVALLPRPQLELGVEVIDAMGGRGGEPASFGDRILDVIPIIDGFFRRNSDFEFSNKMAGVDFHWRVPSWRGFELYDETVVDDLDPRRLRSSLLEDGGYLAGVAFSCLAECGQFGVRAEYHQTGIRFYTHPNYPIEQNGFILGDPLGPRGLGGYLTLDGERARPGYLSLTGAFEVRSGNMYTATATGAHSAGFHFVQTASRPGEKRARALVAWMPNTGDRRITGRVATGVERVANFAFVAGSDRTNWLARGEIVFRP